MRTGQTLLQLTGFNNDDNDDSVLGLTVATWSPNRLLHIKTWWSWPTEPLKVGIVGAYNVATFFVSLALCRASKP